MGKSALSLSCDNTPIPTLETSVVKINYFEKSGY